MMSDFREGWGVKQNRTKSDKGGSTVIQIERNATEIVWDLR